MLIRAQLLLGFIESRFITAIAGTYVNLNPLSITLPFCKFTGCKNLSFYFFAFIVNAASWLYLATECKSTGAAVTGKRQINRGRCNREEANQPGPL